MIIAQSFYIHFIFVYNFNLLLSIYIYADYDEVVLAATSKQDETLTEDDIYLIYDTIE